MKPQSRHIQSLATLQFAAVITIVLAHFWLKDATYLQALCTSFCFVYSGYFTAMKHRDDRPYRLADHARYMRDKLAKLYPLHVFALAFSFLAIFVGWGSTPIFTKVTLAQLLLVSSWSTSPSFYFGINPVAWFICDLFFLYLISPFLIRFIKRFGLGWQAVIVVALIIGQLVAAYAPNAASPSLLIPEKPHYYLYQFPLIRILEFITGIVMYHLTLSERWRKAASRLTPTRATTVELCAIAVLIAFALTGEKLLLPHWYRAYCSVAPAVIAMLGAFVFTSGNMGLASRAMCLPPLPALSRIGAEVYLLQFGSYYLIRSFARWLGMPTNGAIYFLIQMGALLFIAWAVHHVLTMPLYRRLRSRETPPKR